MKLNISVETELNFMFQNRLEKRKDVSLVWKKERFGAKNLIF